MHGIVSAILLALFLAPEAQPLPVLVKSSAFVAGEVEPVATLDGTRVYRLSMDLDSRRPLAGANVEYEIVAADGFVAGGGMFTVRPEMIGPDGHTLSVLTGFGGLELASGSQIVVKLSQRDRPVADPPKRAAGSATEPQIVDTCTHFCDRCAEKAGSLCTQGVQTYNCNCSTGESRSCHFSCYKGV